MNATNALIVIHVAEDIESSNRVSLRGITREAHSSRWHLIRPLLLASYINIFMSLRETRGYGNASFAFPFSRPSSRSENARSDNFEKLDYSLMQSGIHNAADI